MDTIGNTAREVVAEAADSIKKKGGLRRLLGHGLAEILEIAAGGVAAYAGTRAARQFETRHVKTQVEKLRQEGKHEEANALLNTLVAMFTMKDEIAESKALTKVVSHLISIGKTQKADQMLNTFVGLDEGSLNRLGEVLLGLDTEDARYEWLFNFSEATPQQQQKIILTSRIRIPKEHQVGYVFRTEMEEMLRTVRTESSAEIDRLVAEKRRKRATRLPLNPRKTGLFKMIWIWLK